jgi:hypothetical protein
MKPRFGLAEKIAAAARTPASAFDKALAEAIELHRALAALPQLDAPDVRANRLTAKATLRAAMALAGSTEKKLAALEARLAQAPGDHPLLDRLLSVVVAGYATTRRELGAFVEPPHAATAHTLVRTPKEEFGAYRAEAREFDTTIPELIALGVKRATEQHLEVWGAIEDAEQHAAERAHLEQRMRGLCAALDAPPQDEVAVHWIDRGKSVAFLAYRRARRVGIGEGGAALVAALAAPIGA